MYILFFWANTIYIISSKSLHCKGIRIHPVMEDYPDGPYERKYYTNMYAYYDAKVKL